MKILFPERPRGHETREHPEPNVLMLKIQDVATADVEEARILWSPQRRCSQMAFFPEAVVLNAGNEKVYPAR